MRKLLFEVNRLVLIFAIALILSSADCGFAATENGNSETGALYFFTNEGCRPCKQLEPVLRGLADRGYPITKVDTTVYPQWVSQFRIGSTPTVVLVKANREIQRRSGFIDAATLEQWFQSSSILPTSIPPATNTPGNLENKSASQQSFIEALDEKRNGDAPEGVDSTLLVGTRIPGTQLEQIAMNATVRIRVEDPEGISYATGTIIHCREGQWLVMTCGHVFRDSDGKGDISVEYGFENDTPRKAPGTLLSYDAGSRDVGLIAVSAGANVTPVQLADRDASIQRGMQVFSIGCDHGDSPTIRRTKIKRSAKYFADKVTKYDIYGRPVDGRSGGGLFTNEGKLIGVCNAAAVEFDEGIYTALETVYWQIAEYNLDHLFDSNAKTQLLAVAPKSSDNRPGSFQDSGIAGATPKTTPFQRSHPIEGPQPNSVAQQDRAQAPNRIADNRSMQDSIQHVAVWSQDGNPVKPPSTNDMEVILIVRSKTDTTRTDAITLSDPSPQLLGYLEKIGNQQTGQSRVDMAQLRRQLGQEPVVRR